MAYGTPTDPVAGTVITVAYAVANILDPLRWLRTMTGNADPPANNYVVVSTSSTATSWQKVPTDAIADDAITSAKIAAGAVGKPEIADAAVDVNQLALLAVTTAKIADSAVTTAKLADANVTTGKLASATVTQAKIANSAVGTAQLVDANVTTGKLADLAVTAAKIAANTITASQIQNNTIGNSQLVGGTAVANLGFTPSRIVSGTYSGTGATSARQITTGFAVKFVIIHQPSADVMYVAINTTSSLRLGPSPTFVQGSSSIHTHASDGFVVSDGTVQGNVAGSDNYSYTAFG